MSDVTRLLEAAHSGDKQAAAELLPLVYDELRRLAAAKMAGEKPGHTLDATALVHEAYLRLVASPGRESGLPSFASRGHFLRAAAVAMRRILVDQARAKKAAKRGGSRRRLDVELDPLPIAAALDSTEVLDEVLSKFSAEHPEQAELVQLKHFGGLTLEQCAEVLGISARTADTWWAYARAWLAVELNAP